MYAADQLLASEDRVEQLQSQLTAAQEQIRQSQEMDAVTGEEIGGSLKAFDNFCVVVRTGGNYHLIYKHAIAHIRPFEALKKFEAIYENF